MKKPISVLLVEDDPEDALITRSLLFDCTGQDHAQRDCFQLDWVETYDQALAAMKAQVHDVYLVDYRLGTRDGLQLLLEADAVHLPAPVILMTGQGSYELDLEAMEVGAADYLPKADCTPPLLERTIRYAIERKRTEEALRLAHGELEERIQARTTELAASHDQLARTNQEVLRVGQSEHQLRELAEGLVQASMALNSSLNLDDVLDRILEQTLRVIPCSTVAIGLMEGDMVYLAGVAPQRGNGDHSEAWNLLKRNFPLEAMPVLEVMNSTRQPVHAADTEEYPDWRSAPGFEWIRSYAAAPLLVEDEIIGFLNVLSEQPRFFAESVCQRLSAFAAQAAVAIQNARLYDELRRALDQEQAMRDQLVQAEKFAAMGRMVASVAHELNNPLQTIKNCLFLTRQEIEPGHSCQQYLSMAYAETQRLSNLVTQLRELHRSRASAIHLSLVDLAQILQQVRTMLAPQLESQGVHWEQQYAPQESCWVRGDADQLEQVFLNIGTNAVEAMQPAGGKLSIEFSFSHGQRSRNDSRKVGVTFRDTGHGISAECLPNLFEPFYTTKSFGTGLGLSISYEIVARHGGEIEVESQPGQGAAFTVWLPAARLPGREGV